MLNKKFSLFYPSDSKSAAVKSVSPLLRQIEKSRDDILRKISNFVLFAEDIKPLTDDFLEKPTSNKNIYASSCNQDTQKKVLNTFYDELGTLTLAINKNLNALPQLIQTLKAYHFKFCDDYRYTSWQLKDFREPFMAPVALLLRSVQSELQTIHELEPESAIKSAIKNDATPCMK